MSIEQQRKRGENRHQILRTLHRNGPTQKSVLAASLGIRKSSITSIVRELVEGGIVKLEEPEQIRSPISINGSAKAVLVGQIAHESIRTARVMMSGEIRDQTQFEYTQDTTPDAIIKLLAASMGRTLADHRDSIVGLGVTVPGVLNTERGVVINASNLSGWRNIPVSEPLQKILGLPVLLGHDARCELLGNTWFGEGLRKLSSALYVSIHHGIGCSLMVNGKPLAGSSFAAGEIGCLKAGTEGRRCSCGKLDCLQTYCAIPAILSEIRRFKDDDSILSAADLLLAAQKDQSILNRLHHILIPLVEKVAALVALTDPEAVILGSDDPELTALLVPSFREHLRAELFGLHTHATPIHSGIECDLAALLGIAAKTIDRAFASGLSQTA